MMALAIKEHGTPWPADKTQEAFQRFAERNPRGDLWPDIIQQPALRTSDGRQDFPHFWLYSALAAGCEWLIPESSSDQGLQFLLLHMLLAGATATILYRAGGPEFAAAFFLLWLGSPIFWWANNVHTEFFTFCLTTTGLVLAWRQRSGQAALCFAVAGTQNPPWAIAAFLCGLQAVILAYRRERRLPYLWLALAAGIAVIHPLFYAVRFHIVTPQQLTGGASASLSQTREFWRWFLDLDIGLFPNWWIGALLVIPFVILLRTTVAERKAFVLTAGLVVLCLALSQTATVNINHGGTPNVSRYALWYLPAFLAPIVFAIRYVVDGSVWLRLVAVPGVLFVLVANIHQYSRSIEPDYLRPTWLSNWMAATFPKFYPWNFEIFAERHIHQESPPKGWPIVIASSSWSVALVDLAALSSPDSMRAAPAGRGPVFPLGTRASLREFAKLVPRLDQRSAGGTWSWVFPNVQQRSALFGGAVLDTDWAGDFYPAEEDNGRNWRWSGKNGRLVIRNRGFSAATGTLWIEGVSAIDGRDGVLTISGGLVPVVTKAFSPESGDVPLAVRISIPPGGRSTLDFQFSGESRSVRGRPHGLAFRLHDVRLELDPVPPQP